MAQISYGTITITDTNDIERIYPVYCRGEESSAPALLPLTNWKENISEITVSGDYIWQRIVTKKSGINVTQNDYSDAVRLTGTEGDAALNISAVEVQYGSSANWSTSPSNWGTNTPAYDSTKPYYWTRTRLKYENNTYSSWITNKDNGLTDAIAQSVEANANAAMAESLAQSANENSQGAMSQAAATQYEMDALDAKLKYFFYPGDSNYPGVYAASGIDGTPFNESSISTYGYNVAIKPASIGIGYNNVKAILIDGSSPSLKFYVPSKTTQATNPSMTLTSSALIFNKIGTANKSLELTSSALNFYGSSTSTVDATLTSTGLKLVKGGIEAGTIGSNGGLYISTIDKSGIAINGYTPGTNDPKWRAIIGSKFGVDSAGNLYASNAHIEGSITATELLVGNQNSNYISYNSQDGLQIDASNLANERMFNYIDYVMGFSDWANQYGTFKLTKDTAVIPGKPYFQEYGVYEYIDNKDIYFVHTNATTIEPGDMTVYYIISASIVINPIIDNIYQYYTKNSSNIYIHVEGKALESGVNYYTLTGTKVSSPSTSALTSYYETNYPLYHITTANIVSNPVQTDLYKYYELSNEIYTLTTDTILKNPYKETKDTVYNSSKTYYITQDTAEGIEYIQFTGNTFDSNTVYYEKNNYYILTCGLSDISENGVNKNKNHYILNKKYIRIDESDIIFSNQNDYYEIFNLNEVLSPYTHNHVIANEYGVSVVDDSGEYSVQINSNGVNIVSATDGILATYGDNISFNSEKDFTIGNTNGSIIFEPEIGINIVANSLRIRGNDIESKISDVNNSLEAQKIVNANLTALINDEAQTRQEENQATTTRLNTIDSQVTANTEALKVYTGYIDINPNIPAITVCTTNNSDNSTSAIQITSEQLSFIENNNTIAWVTGEKLYITSAVVTNLFMETKVGNTVYGGLGWVMRSDGHLSLKSMS